MNDDLISCIDLNKAYNLKNLNPELGEKKEPPLITIMRNKGYTVYEDGTI
mgnify:CR=1 FL=1